MPYGRPVWQLRATLSVRVVSAEAGDGAAAANSSRAAIAEPRAVALRRRAVLFMDTSRSFQLAAHAPDRRSAPARGRAVHGGRRPQRSSRIPCTAEHGRISAYARAR